MKMKLLLATTLCSLCIIWSCEKQPDNCYREELTAAFINDYPDTVQVYETFLVKVNYVVDNSCGNEVVFEGETGPNMLTVKMKTIYEGCSCDDGFMEKSASHPIVFETAGTYTLKFWVGQDEYESYSIVVTE